MLVAAMMATARKEHRQPMNGPPSQLKVAVIGGGISGIRAALTLARAGCRVTLLEKNKHLGGRVFSFITPDFGEVDIGQHIWLRSCVALEGLLHDLGVPDDWVYRQDRISMPYRQTNGTTFVLAATRLPGTLSFLPTLVRMPGLGVIDKVQYLLATIRASLYSPRQLEQLDTISIADWLRRQRQSQAVVEWFWQPFVVGVCNGRLTEVSARHALVMVRETMLKSPEACAVCLLRRPLSAVFDRLARQVLQAAGAAVCTGEAVSAIRPGASVEVRTSAGQTRHFDRVITAVPLKRLRALVPEVGLPTPPEEGAIAGLLLRFARPVMEELFFAAVGSCVQHVFNKTTIWGQIPEDGSQIIELVLSAAEREVKLGVDGLAAELLPALARHLPSVKRVPLLARRMLVHGTATFRVTPGGEARRLPPNWPGLTNVVLAGDYAATGLPSTMESAAVAGDAAAQLVLGKSPGPWS
jgi:squalene-associated FAD-dependent desaturase